MKVEEKIFELEEIIKKSNSTHNYASQKVIDFFKILMEEYTPKKEIKNAIAYGRKWEIEFSNHANSENEKFDNLLKDVSRITKKIDDDFKLMQKGILPKNSDADINSDVSRLPKLEDLFDKEKQKQLFADFDIVWRLDIFEKAASKELKTFKVRFYFFRFILWSSRGIIYITGIILSYFIGLTCEDLLKFDPIIVTLISSLICFYTIEKFLNDIKERVFWRELTKIVNHLKFKYVIFKDLKTAFKNFAQKHPQIIQ